MDWKITIGFCAIEAILTLVVLYIMVTSEPGKGVGSKKRAMILLGSIVAMFVAMLAILYIMYSETTGVVSPGFILMSIFLLGSGGFLIRLILSDIKKYSKKPSVT